jgi:hypothetical protein
LDSSILTRFEPNLKLEDNQDVQPLLLPINGRENLDPVETSFRADGEQKLEGVETDSDADGIENVVDAEVDEVQSENVPEDHSQGNDDQFSDLSDSDAEDCLAR